MNTLSKTGLYNALGVAAYIALVSLVMSNADQLFGTTDTYLSQVAFLSLFALSAVMVSSLVLGKPLMMYLDGKKKEAVSLFMQTVGWLAGFTVVLLIVLTASK